MKLVFKIQLYAIAVLLVIGSFFGVKEILFLQKAELVNARLTKVDFIKSHDSEDRNDEYTLEAEVIGSGRKIGPVSYSVWFGDPEFKTGQNIKMYYYKDAPEKSEVKDLWQQWGETLIVAFIILMELLSGVVLFIVLRNRKTGNPVVSE